jgi:hypothetical protein
MLGFYLAFVILSMFSPVTIGWAAICHFAARDRPRWAFIAAALGGFVMWGILSVNVRGALIFASVGAIATSLWWVSLYLGDGLAVRVAGLLKTSGRGRAIAIVAVAAVAVSAIAYDLTYASRVMRSAAAVAGGARSCITLPRLNRQARAWSDLRYTALPRGSAEPNALLLVDEGGGRIAAFHWSYWQAAFEPDSRNSGGYGNWVCRPKSNYAQTLPLWPVTDYVEVRFQDRFIYVPLDYQPTGWGHHVSIRTEGPGFKPLGQYGDTAMIRPAEGGFSKTFGVLQPLDTKYGLTRVNMPANQIFPQAEYRVEQDRNGTIQTFVQCLGPERCNMHIVEGGLNYSFPFPRAALPQWQAMRAKFIKLFRSFDVEPR